MHVYVEVPDVDSEINEESDTVEVSLGRGEVQSCVPIVVVLLRVSSATQRG